jgi:hypothetical protein
VTEFRVLPHVYQVGGPHLTDAKDCSVFLIRDDPSVLIDCGAPDGVPAFMRYLAAIGYGGDPYNPGRNETNGVP